MFHGNWYCGIRWKKVCRLNWTAANFNIRTGYNAKINDIEYKIPSISDLVKKTDHDAKISGIKGEIPNVKDLVKKTDYNAKVNEINGKIPDINHLVVVSYNSYIRLAIADFDAKILDIEKKLLVHLITVNLQAK